MKVGVSTIEPELKTLFDQFVGERSYLEGRWEDYAGWTLPYLYPNDEMYSTTEMQHDYQSLGAKCVNHLANKIVMTLFPPQRPFFRIRLNEQQEALLVEQGVEQADVELVTSMAERKAMREAEAIRARSKIILLLKNLIALGNGLIYFPHKGSSSVAQVYNMRDYIVKRDMNGEVLLIIMRDTKSVHSLPQEHQDILLADGLSVEDDVELYTGVARLSTGAFFVKQELNETIISTQGTFAEKDLPWNAPAWNLVRGQDYGNGLVEEYAGDFHVISSISESNVNLTAIASDIKILVNPMGQTDVDTLNNSAPGTYVYGIPTDVAYLQMEKLNELQFVTSILDNYERRVSSAFLLNTQVTRDAERVTAEEIRMNINELEGSLGGVYSRLGEELQQPLARYLLGKVNPLLAQLEPAILTGVESLNRNSEHEQIMLLIQDMTMMQNIPEPLAPYIKYSDIVKVLASNRGLEYTKFVKDQDQVDEERAAAEERQQQQIIAEEAAAGMGQVAAGQVSGAPTQMGPNPL